METNPEIPWNIRNFLSFPMIEHGFSVCSSSDVNAPCCSCWISTEDHRALEFLGFRFTHCGGGGSFVFVSLPLTWKVNCRVVDWWIKFFAKVSVTLRGVGMNLHLIALLMPFFVPISQQFFPQSSLEICAEPSDICRPWWKPRRNFTAPSVVLCTAAGLDVRSWSGWRVRKLRVHRKHTVTHMPTANAVAPEILEFLVGVTDCCGAVM